MLRLPTSTALLRSAKVHKHQLALRMRLRYEADLAGGTAHEYASERAPRVHMYLSDELSLIDATDGDDGVTVVASRELANREGVELMMPFAPWHINRSLTAEAARWPLPGNSKHVLPDENGRWTLPADTYVCSSIIVHTATDSGRAVDTRGGNSFHLLSELLDAAEHVRIEWQRNGDKALAKGFLALSHVELVSVASDGRVVVLDARKFIAFEAPSERAVFHGDEETTRLAAAADAMQNKLTEHANRAMRVFFPQATAPLGRSDPAYMRPLHCPYYLTPGGMLDGSMYALNGPRRVPSAAFYDRTLAAVLVRNDVLASDLLLAIGAQRQEPARLLEATRYVEGKIYGELFTVFANQMPYLNDFVNESGNTYEVVERKHKMRFVHGVGGAAAIAVDEDYKIARLYHADDCEGVGLEIHMEARQLARAKFDGDAEDIAQASHKLLHDFQHVTFTDGIDASKEAVARLDLLHHFQRMARACVYVEVLPLAAVTNKNLDHSQRELDEKNVLAHTFSSLVPTALLLARLENADADDDLVAAVRASRHVRTYLASSLARAYDIERDVLVLEGTARASALQVPTSTLFASASPARRAAEVRAAEQRLAAQATFMHANPTIVGALSFEVMQRRVDDARGDFAADRESLSDFYQSISSVYTAAFADVGILDLALARRRDDGSLTHALHFNKFAAVAAERSAEWRFVPYNRIDAVEGARAERILSRLEPVPALTIARNGQVPRVAAFERLRGSPSRTGAASAVLRRDPSAMPGVPRSFVVSVRAEELADKPQLADQLASALRSYSARVVAYYLADPPVVGDELPPVVIYDIEVRLDESP